MRNGSPQENSVRDFEKRHTRCLEGSALEFDTSVCQDSRLSVVSDAGSSCFVPRYVHGVPVHVSALDSPDLDSRGCYDMKQIAERFLTLGRSSSQTLADSPQIRLHVPKPARSTAPCRHRRALWPSSSSSIHRWPGCVVGSIVCILCSRACEHCRGFGHRPVV